MQLLELLWWFWRKTAEKGVNLKKTVPRSYNLTGTLGKDLHSTTNPMESSAENLKEQRHDYRRLALLEKTVENLSSTCNLFSK